MVFLFYGISMCVNMCFSKDFVCFISFSLVPFLLFVLYYSNSFNLLLLDTCLHIPVCISNEKEKERTCIWEGGKELGGVGGGTVIRMYHMKNPFSRKKLGDISHSLLLNCFSYLINTISP